MNPSTENTIVADESIMKTIVRTNLFYITIHLATALSWLTDSIILVIFEIIYSATSKSWWWGNKTKKKKLQQQ